MTLGITWTGTDGSVWDLRAGTAPGGGPGVKLSDKGILGLGMPAFDYQLNQTAGQDGQELDDLSAQARSVRLPVRFKTADLAVQGAFWKSLSVYGSLGRYGRLRVTNQATGIYRELVIRFEDDGGKTLTQDPEFLLNDVWVLSFMADAPFWVGAEVVTSYSQADSASANFFGETGAPPFNISANFGAGSTNLVNPGEIPAWLRFEVEGQATEFYTFVNSSLIDARAIAVSAGSRLTIETNPLIQFADLDGQPVNWRLYSFDAVPIPGAGSASVYMALSGAGRARARFTPRFLRGY